MSAHNDQDLLPEGTAGFKVGEKKTMDQYNQLGGLLLYFWTLFSLPQNQVVILLSNN